MRGFRFILKPWFLNLCLLVLFVFLTGLPQSCWHDYQTVKIKKPVQLLSQAEISKGRNILQNYAKEKIAEAKYKISRGETYTFVDYFNYRKELNKKIKSLNLESYFHDGEGFLGVQEMLQLSLPSLKSNGNHAALEAAQEDYEKTCDPRYPIKKKAKEDFNASGWFGILIWFLFLYLKTMPLACGFFLIQLFENQKSKEGFSFPNPLNFLIMLLAYPVVIGNIFAKWWNYTKREYQTEVEYRRTKENLFTYLSDSEVRKIKTFAKSALSLRSWREQLAASGLKPQHSLALALVVTLLINFVPSLAQAETKKEGDCQHKVCLQQAADQYTARINIGDDQPAHGFNHDWQDRMPIIFEENDFNPVVTIWYLKNWEKVFQFKNVCRQIDHIPLYGYSANSLLNINLTE